MSEFNIVVGIELLGQLKRMVKDLQDAIVETDGKKCDTF